MIDDLSVIWVILTIITRQKHTQHDRNPIEYMNRNPIEYMKLPSKYFYISSNDNNVVDDLSKNKKIFGKSNWCWYQKVECKNLMNCLVSL